MNYSLKLKDPRWQKKRLEILDRDNFTCQCCGDSKTELHVHHKSYNGNPWESENEDLKTVCKHCHLIHHEVGIKVFKVYKYYYKELNIWSINVYNDKVITCFLYDGNGLGVLEPNGLFELSCFNELHNAINHKK